MVFWPEYVGSWAEGFPPVHRINLGRLTQEDYKKFTIMEPNKKGYTKEGRQRQIDCFLNKS